MDVDLTTLTDDQLRAVLADRNETLRAAPGMDAFPFLALRALDALEELNRRIVALRELCEAIEAVIEDES